MKNLGIIMLMNICCFLGVSCSTTSEKKIDNQVTDKPPIVKDSNVTEQDKKKNDISEIKDAEKKKPKEVDNMNRHDGFMGVLEYFWSGVSATCRAVKTSMPEWW